MNRHVQPVGAGPASVLTTVRAGWCRFWFEPISTVTIGLFRIVYGSLLLLFVALLLPDLWVWFGQRGMFPPALAEQFWRPVPHLTLPWVLQSDAGVVLFFAGFTAAAFCLTIGLYTRVSATVAFIGLVAISYRSPLILNGGDTALRVVGFYLIFSPVGAALSVDRLRALARGTGPARPPLAAPWAQRLIQLQLSLIYASTVLLKLRGHDWADGVALYYTSRLEEFHRFPLPFVSHSLLLINVMTYWTIGTEIAMAFLVWIRPLRPFVLLSGLALHAGIEYSMNIPGFSFIMMAGYITFVDVEALWEQLRAYSSALTLRGAPLRVAGPRVRVAHRGMQPGPAGMMPPAAGDQPQREGVPRPMIDEGQMVQRWRA